MNNCRLEQLGESDYKLSGELNFDTVPILVRETKAIFTSPSEHLNIDLSGISKTNSAGLALLIEWTRSAKHNNKNIVFKNIPEKMLAIARVSDLGRILPLAETEPKTANQHTTS